MQSLIARLFKSPSSPLTKTQITAYWIVTVIIALESMVGGVADIMQEPIYIKTLLHLGYPAYFSVILGVGKVLAAVVILIPRYPRLKEWAYAGLVFQFIGAIASQIVVGATVTMLIAPFIFLCLVMASWFLRPSWRRI
jgi:hypothetical protein